MRRIEPTDALRKPRPTHHRAKYFQQLEKFLFNTPGVKELHLTLAHKADGVSGSLAFTAEGMLVLDYRTRHGGTMLEPIANNGLYLREDLAGKGMTFHVECCAFLHGKELGHYFVDKALEKFKHNGHANRPSEPLKLRLRIFGLHSVRDRAPTKPMLDELAGMPIQGNNLVDTVPHEDYHMEKRGGGVRFLDAQRKFICTDYNDFCEQQLERAKRCGDEGWVLQVREEVFGDDTVLTDAFEGHRHLASLKIKPEPEVLCLAAKVEDQTDRSTREQALISLYCRQGERLVYAGNASDNDAIRAQLASKTAALVYHNAEERSALYSLTLADFRGSAVQLRVLVASITPGGYLSGIKQYGVQRHSWITVPELSNLKVLATKFAHFVSTSQGRAEYQRLTKEQLEDNPYTATTTTRKRKPAAPLEPRPAVAREHSPPREHSPAREPLPVVPLPVVPARQGPVTVIRGPPRRGIMYTRNVKPAPAAVRPEPQPVPQAEPAAIQEEAAPEVAPPEPKSRDEIEEEAWIEYARQLRAPLTQDIFYYEAGKRMPYNGVVPCLPGGRTPAESEWPVAVFWPVEGPPGRFHWKELHVGKPPELFDGTPYREYQPGCLQVYLHPVMAEDELLGHLIRFFGGKVLLEPGPEADIAIVPARALREFEAGDTINICYWDRETMPHVRFETKETIRRALTFSREYYLVLNPLV
jgi:hypothetical protein